MLKFYLKDSREVYVDMTIDEFEKKSRHDFSKISPIEYCLFTKFIIFTNPKRAINMDNVLYIEEIEQ